MHRIGAKSAAILWTNEQTPQFWKDITSFLELNAIGQPDFALDQGRNETIHSLIRQINRGNYEFDRVDRHEVWAAFTEFLISFDEPTLPKNYAEILKKSGTFL